MLYQHELKELSMVSSISGNGQPNVAEVLKEQAKNVEQQRQQAEQERIRQEQLRQQQAEQTQQSNDPQRGQNVDVRA
ncbi:hypothetical protein tinsulaeT_31640 [Thalassotalea insulae]|uniref:Uncharacterized protein n=2 Tax=Thalassotalea insulae TaxID=2056778 RepID=A0ABQ6GXB2_9GAMM|nr:hypothetical protein tinsulaeT_31640 [Thalassotalea insulae]